MTLFCRVCQQPILNPGNDLDMERRCRACQQTAVVVRTRDGSVRRGPRGLGITEERQGERLVVHLYRDWSINHGAGSLPYGGRSGRSLPLVVIGLVCAALSLGSKLALLGTLLVAGVVCARGVSRSRSQFRTAVEFGPDAVLLSIEGGPLAVPLADLQGFDGQQVPSTNKTCFGVYVRRRDALAQVLPLLVPTREEALDLARCLNGYLKQAQTEAQQRATQLR